MPGIVGIVSQRRSQEYSAMVESMVKCLMHEPFYNDGTYVNEELGLWSGWACHKGAFEDCLPIWNEKKDICLLFSGEDFVDQAEIDALECAGMNLAQITHIISSTCTKKWLKSSWRSSTAGSAGFWWTFVSRN